MFPIHPPILLWTSQIHCTHWQLFQSVIAAVAATSLGSSEVTICVSAVRALKTGKLALTMLWKWRKKTPHICNRHMYSVVFYFTDEILTKMFLLLQFHRLEGRARYNGPIRISWTPWHDWKTRQPGYQRQVAIVLAFIIAEVFCDPSWYVLSLQSTHHTRIWVLVNLPGYVQYRLNDSVIFFSSFESPPFLFHWYLSKWLAIC